MSDLDLMVAAFVLSVVAVAVLFWKYRKPASSIKKQPRDSRGRFAKKDNQTDA